ncbi:recombinase family protein [Pelosinus sp. IPA-1]|uniref:recombinase family protein n=1 Tax=Pelosinus sp. IPA-1 TaxID=3029569 RepID=UPI0024362939|nr:recombinase family protein [Pelosinus sp. IPA-1]GMB00864.1 serine recombinase [Pelosinus sp. IPA-1]
MSNQNHKDLEPSCFYLRKSREDQEAESRGEGETLAKHKKALFKTAKLYGVNISKVFEEVVSGESIIHRPEMLSLLKEIEEGKWKSVFCMDIDRLGRGKMQDQGLIIETFKQAKTKIVTPRKIYDLNDEWDEEYTEFESFMARKELKIITRRLQSGRIRSLEDGNYLGTVPPYGYLIDKKDRKRYLIKNPEQSEPTTLIWKLYRMNMGTNKIANELNDMGYLSYTGKKWSASSILAILKNPAYAGVNAWKKVASKKSTTRIGRETKLRPKEEQIWIYDCHEPYVTLEEFEQVQQMLSKKYHPPYQLINGITNPLAGLIKCDICGGSMIYRPYQHQQYPHLMCYNRHCSNKSCRFEYVEQKIVESLQLWLNEYRAQWDNFKASEQDNTIDLKEKVYKNLKKELKELELQKDNLHDLLEKGIYNADTYLERSAKISEKIANTQKNIDKTEFALSNEIQHEKAKKDIIPKVQHVLEVYEKSNNPTEKNNMLKSVLENVTYRKEKWQKGDQFTLVINPRLPQ